MKQLYQPAWLTRAALLVCISLGMAGSLVLIAFKPNPLISNQVSSANSSSALERIVFAPCEGADVETIESQCGRFYPDPNNAFIYIAFAKLTPAKASKNAAPIVYFSGGPGEGGNTSGAKLDSWRYRMLDWAIQRPLIVWDSRGNTGAWGEFHCMAYQELMLAQLRMSEVSEQTISEQPGPLDSAPVDWGLSDESEVIQSCLQQWHTQLNHTGFDQFSSWQSASDLLGLLDALNIEQWHAVSVSYGSRVAQWLAHLRPAGMLSALFDSPYGWHVQTSRQRMDRWQLAFERFYQVCQQEVDCHQQHDVKALVESSFTKLRKQPLSVAYSLEGRIYRAAIDDIQLRHILFSDLYWPSQYAPWVNALEHLMNGNSNIFEGLIQPVLESKLAVRAAPWLYWVTECNDNVQENNVAQEDRSADIEQHEAARYWQPGTQFHICRQLSSKQFSPAQSNINSLFADHTPVSVALPPPSTPYYPRIVLVGEYDPVVTLDDAVRVSGANGMVFIGHAAGHGLFYDEVCDVDWLSRYWAEPQWFIDSLTRSFEDKTADQKNRRVPLPFGRCQLQL